MGEECDDGNVASGDGCSATCTIERCGNGVVEAGEVCDDANNVTGDGCSADCRSVESCGNGVVDPVAGEVCDDGSANGDGPDTACRPDCQPGRCGDGIVDPGRGEECDGSTGGATCGTEGFYGGTLRCIGCRLDRSDCDGRCGDGVLNGAEACDRTDFGSRTCADFGFYTGRLSCSADCASISTAACRDRCGDGVRNGTELCDGNDVGGASCRSYGFYSGVLACSLSCDALDPAGCRETCGDGIRNGVEVCDPGSASAAADLGALTCQSFGYYEGTLGCGSDCGSIEPSGCRGYCGDGIVNGPEECDGRDQGGLYCLSFFGYSGGSLGCDAQCRRTFDTCLRSGFVPEPSGTLFTLNDVWAGSASDAVAVGEGGTILQYDGRRWAPVNVSGLTSRVALRTIAARYTLEGIELWVAGDEGTLLRRRPSLAGAPTWQLESLALPGALPTRGRSSPLELKQLSFRASWSDNVGVVLLSDYDLSFVWAASTQQWSAVDLCPTCTVDVQLRPSGVWRAPTEELVIAESNRKFVPSDQASSIVVKAPSGQSQQWVVDGSEGLSLNAVWGESIESFWVAGAQGFVAHYTHDGVTGRWGQEPTDTQSGLTRFVRGADDRLYLVGEVGTLLVREPVTATWTSVSTGTTASLSGAALLASGERFFVSVSGLILHDIPSPWRDVGQSAVVGGGRLSDGTLPGTFLVAVTLFDPIAEVWKPFKQLPGWVTRPWASHDQLFAADYGSVCGQPSAASKLHRFDRSTGDEVVTEMPPGVWRALWADAQGSAAWAVGDPLVAGSAGDSHIVRWSKGPGGDAWSAEPVTPLPSGDVGVPQTVHGTSVESLYAATSTGALLRYVPASRSWTQFPSPTSESLVGAWSDPGGGAVFVGGDAQGRLVRFDGLGASLEQLPLGPPLYAVWGRSFSDLFVTGEGGLLLHFDGASWSPTRLPGKLAQYRLVGISGSEEQGVLLSGVEVGTSGKTLGAWFRGRYPTLPLGAVPLACGSTTPWSGAIRGDAPALGSFACEGATLGAGALYRLHAPVHGSLSVVLESVIGSHSMALLPGEVSGPTRTSCLGRASTAGGANPASITVPLQSAQFVYVAVAGAGTYRLKVTCTKGL